MAKDADQRFQSGEELAAALRPYGENAASSTGMNIPAIAPAPRPAPAPLPTAPQAPNPHASGTVKMQAVPAAGGTPDADKTVILPPAAGAKPAAAGKGDDVDISL